MSRANQVLFLSGGGKAEDSKVLERAFVAALAIERPLVYVPVAKGAERHEAAFAWFQNVFRSLGHHVLEMWTDLRSQPRPLEDIAGLYIAGGRTTRLLEELHGSGFDLYLEECLRRGVPVCGGSAGAIIFGVDVRTAPEARVLEAGDARGLNALFGHSVGCHYDSKWSVSGLEMDGPIVAIPERSGARITGDLLTVVGFEALWVLTGEAQLRLAVGEEYHLAGSLRCERKKTQEDVRCCSQPGD